MAAPAPRPLAFAIRGPIRRADMPGLCDRVCTLLTDTAAPVAVCDVLDVEPDAVTVDALARLQLAARRHASRIYLRGASADLLGLVAFMGLTDVLPAGDEFRAAPPSKGRTQRPRRNAMTQDTSRKLFVNIAVEDLDRAVGFFTQLGFSFDPRFTDETATSMLVGEDAYVMLLVRDRFADFTTKPTADSHAQTEAILAVSAESREAVDHLAERALAGGGTPARDPMELGFMYGRSFHDPDGHLWEVFWMDPVVAGGDGPVAAEAAVGAES
jgi:uncharacterized protein